jgi:hypothetical protein
MAKAIIYEEKIPAMQRAEEHNSLQRRTMA